MREDEGLPELRARVADAFGLSAPFDLVSSDGVPLGFNADALRAAHGCAALGVATPGGGVGGSCCAAQQVSVEAGEEALLDLERAHEETGATRWVLLRKLITGLRRQIAEAVASIADSQRRAAVLDEQLVRERSGREAGDAALHGELRSLAMRLEEELGRGRAETLARLDGAITELGARTEAMVAQQASEQAAELGVLKQGLLDEKEARVQATGKASQELDDLQNDLRREAEARVEALRRAADADMALKAEVDIERQQRLESQARAEEGNAEFRVLLSEERALRDKDVKALRDSINEALAACRAEQAARTEAVRVVGERIQEDTRSKEAALGAQEATFERRLTQLADADAELRLLLSAERTAREEADAGQARATDGLAATLRREAEAERNRVEECARADNNANAEAIDSERKQRKEDMDRRLADLQAVLIARVEKEVEGRVTEAAALRSECGSIREALESERRAREDACAKIVAAEAVRREDAAAEAQRWHSSQAEEQREWVRVLVDRVTADLRAEREAAAADSQRRCGEVAATAAERVRALVMAEVNRIEVACADLIRGQEAARADDRTRYENQARLAAEEVKAALEAHGEFMEVLEREQRLLIERFNEGMARQGSLRDELEARVRALECDMRMVRGHLPILFAAPTAFR